MTDLENLPSLKELQAMAQPAKLICGVYFLFKGYELVYVGATANILRRIGDHLRDKEFDTFAYVEVEPARLNMVEQIYLMAFKPAMNKFHGLHQNGHPRAMMQIANALREKSNQASGASDGFSRRH